MYRAVIPKVCRKISLSGPPIPIQINILSFAEHKNVQSGPRTRKIWEPLVGRKLTIFLIS
jgi:hypothetical protein